MTIRQYPQPDPPDRPLDPPDRPDRQWGDTQCDPEDLGEER